MEAALHSVLPEVALFVKPHCCCGSWTVLLPLSVWCFWVFAISAGFDDKSAYAQCIFAYSPGE